MSERLTVIKPTANIRRGPTMNAGIIRAAKNGEQFKVLDVVKLQGLEVWVKVEEYDRHGALVDAYICAVMPSGARLAELSGTNLPVDDFAKGYKAGVTHAVEVLTQELLKLK